MTDNTVVILIHGIRTAGWWQNRVASILADKTKAVVIPLKYGYFDVLRFWCPFGWCRDPPIERLRQQIAGIREQYKGRRLIVFAHSYGTYALSRILLANSFFKFDRIILCGSIIRDNFDWSRLQSQIIPDEKRDAIINECGLRDVYPVLAKSGSWGYGESGTYGFGDYNVRDRFHPITHSEFFESERIIKYWVPAVAGEPIEFSESDTREGKTPWWFAILRFLPLRWLIIALLIGLLFAAAHAIILALSNPAPPKRPTQTQACEDTGYLAEVGFKCKEK